MNTLKLLTEKQISQKQIPWEEGRHIYFLLKDDIVVYIGKCSKSLPNLLAHRDKDFTDYYILGIDDENADIDLIHAEYILNLVPKYNGNLPTNEFYMRKSQMKKKFDVDGFELNRLIKENGANTVYHDYYDIREVFKRSNQ